jgi:hypothetical protein
MDLDSQQAWLFANIGVLLRLVVLSLLLERGLAFVFEHEWYVRWLTKEKTASNGESSRQSLFPGLKGLLALAAAMSICWRYNFDVIEALFCTQQQCRAQSTPMGLIATGLIAAGGSAGAIKLFQGVMGLGKEARDHTLEARKLEAEALKAIAIANAERAKAENRS